MYHTTLKFEEQLKRKKTRYQGKSWKGDECSNSNDNVEKIERKLDVRDDKNGKPETFTHHRDLRCFKCNGVGYIASQCVSKKTMVVLRNDKYATASENENDSDMPRLEDASDGKEYPVEGKEFVMFSRRD